MRHGQSSGIVRRLCLEDDNLLRLTTYRRSSFSRNAFSDFLLIEEMTKFCLPEGIAAEASGRTINSESFVQQSDLNRIALSVRLKRQCFIAVELHGELGRRRHGAESHRTRDLRHTTLYCS